MFAILHQGNSSFRLRIFWISVKGCLNLRRGFVGFVWRSFLLMLLSSFSCLLGIIVQLCHVCEEFLRSILFGQCLASIMGTLECYLLHIH